MRYDVITIGSATQDALIRSKAFKTIESRDFVTGRALAVELGSKIAVEDVFFGTGGAATNTAVTLARQGFKTAIIARVGSDTLGRAVREEMERENIGVEWLAEDSEKATGYSVILELESGERTILTHRGANEQLNAREIPWDEIPCAWMYLSSLSGDLEIIEAAMKSASRCGGRVVWNPGGSDLALGLKKLAPLLKMVSVFIVNQEEASKLLGISYDDVNAIFKKFDEVISGVAVMTRGPEGVYASDGKTLWKAGIFREQKVADRTGAGDAFGAGFAAGLMRLEAKLPSGGLASKQIEYAIRLGSANATSKVEHVGAKGGLLTRDEFERDARWKDLPVETTPLA